MSLKGTNRPYRLEGDVLNRDGLSLRSRALVLNGGLLDLGGGLGGVEVAENGDVGIVEETGIRLKAGFRVHATAEDTEIVREETDAVFEAGAGKVVLKVMGTTTGNGLHGTVVLAGLRPASREMIGVEFVVALTVTRGAYNDALWGEFNIQGASRMPSAIEDVQNDNAPCTKILRNGQIYVLRGEKVYTLQGQEVR